MVGFFAGETPHGAEDDEAGYPGRRREGTRGGRFLVIVFVIVRR